MIHQLIFDYGTRRSFSFLWKRRGGRLPMLAFLSCLLILSFSINMNAKIPVYIWQGYDDFESVEAMRNDFKQWKKHHVVGVCINAGMDRQKIATAAKIAKEEGLIYHAWIPTVLQQGLDKSWYTVNRLGQSAYDNPPYVPYYKTLDPRNPAVIDYLVKQFSEIAETPHVDYIQLDYIRYADVILAKGLWAKYNLVMHEEYPNADFCYCDDCVEAFKAQSGIDIRQVKDPSKIKSWAKFRCDAVTHLVNTIAAAVHAKGKKVSADVFPGPKSHAVPMVRQEWNKWNLDAVFPMNYNDFYLEPASWLKKITKEEVRSVKNKNIPVYSGLFICRDWRNKDKVVDPENSGLLPSEIAEAVRGSIKGGAAGICLFTAHSMTEEHWAALDEVINQY